jgi:hypothetical protein
MKLKASLCKTALNLSLPVIFGAMALVFGATAYAQQPKTDANSTGQVTQPSANDVSTSADPLPLTLPFNSVNLSVKVDRGYCATGGVQCSGPGLSFAAAADTNRNPIRLGLQVVNSNGSPVANLTDAEIAVVNPFVPAGGTAITQFSCASCFQNAGNGQYAIFVSPANSANWKSGSYFAQVQVKIGSNTYRELVQVSIPF